MDSEIIFLKEFLVIFGLSGAALFVCHRLKIPIVVGFLLTGVIAGPHGLKLVHAVSDVQTLARIGVILLLFAVGLEFSMKKMLQLKRFFLFSGALQVSLTIFFTFLIAKYIGAPLGESLFLGFLVSQSSTTIVLRQLDERREQATTHGRICLGTLIFQDLIIVPMLLLVPIIGEGHLPKDISVLWVIIKSIVIVGAVFFSAKWLVPKMLYHFSSTKIRELFLFSIITICFFVVWVAGQVGLPLSIGAFLAGLLLAESEYSIEALGDIIPFRDVFISLFFVSVGMLLDFRFFLDHFFLVLIATGGIFLLKSLVMFLTGLLSGLTVRASILSGIALFQLGEFSFVIARAGIASNIGSDFYYQLFFAVAVLSMGLTPALMALAPFIADQIEQMPIPKKLRVGLWPIPEEKIESLSDHMIIVGYDLIGKSLVQSAIEAKIPYIILEMDPDKVRSAKLEGIKMIYGDATNHSVLRYANLDAAKVVLILIHNPLASFRIVDICRRMNPNAYLVVRTRYVEEVQPMFQLGANEVIPDEFGSSVEIFLRVLKYYNIPKLHIDHMISKMRREVFNLLRFRYGIPTLIPEINLTQAGVDVRTFRVAKGSELVGSRLQDVDLKSKYGVTVLMISREDQTISHLTGNTMFYAEDLVVILGTEESMNKAAKLFNAKP